MHNQAASARELLCVGAGHGLAVHARLELPGEADPEAAESLFVGCVDIRLVVAGGVQGG